MALRSRTAIEILFDVSTQEKLVPELESIMTSRETILNRLNAVHSFPCIYVFKVIGSNSPDFISRVVQAAVNVVGDNARPTISTRESSGGKHLSVTLSVEVQDADIILEIYGILQSLDGVKFML